MLPFAWILMVGLGLFQSTPPDPRPDPRPTPEQSPAAPEPRIGLTPITELPESIAPVLPPPPAEMAPDPAAPHRLSFLGDGAVAQRVREAWLRASLSPTDTDFLTALSTRARAGYAFDTSREPLFSDRNNIHLATNQPGDHSDSHFTLTNIEVSRGVFLRADGVGRAFDIDKRYTTLSAEAYFALGANAGMALGFDVLRTGLPGEDATLEDGLFARFIIGF